MYMYSDIMSEICENICFICIEYVRLGLKENVYVSIVCFFINYMPVCLPCFVIKRALHSRTML